MTKPNPILERLQRLGLTPYEAQVFFELYKRSPQTATGLAKASKVPRGRIYDVLRSLSERGLILEKPVGGSPTLYEYPVWHKGLDRLRHQRDEELKQERMKFEDAYEELVTLLATVNREVEADYKAEERQRLVPVSGAFAQSYYIKKILDGAQATVLTNFTADLLLKYQSSFLDLQKRKVTRTFLLFETELPQVLDIVKGAEVFMLSERFLDSPLISAFKDRRPSMIIVDDEVSVLMLLGHSQDALLVRNPELLQYQQFILNLFKQSGERRVIE
ncbi:MAG: TrmB family transcriptional regulator [Promethearchaeota archaeon]